MEPSGNHAPRSNTAKIFAVASRARWLVPLIALSAIALPLLELDIGPVAWNKPVAETAGRVAGLTGEQSVCIFLALTMLIYWGIRERQEAAADLVVAAAWLTGIPGMAIVAGWVVKGAKFVFATLKRKVYEQIRSEGHAEGHAEGRQEANAEWQAWWQRRTASLFWTLTTLHRIRRADPRADSLLAFLTPNHPSPIIACAAPSLPHPGAPPSIFRRYHCGNRIRPRRPDRRRPQHP